MSRYFCDLHIHSCLSPCADDDMTPGNIAGMAVLNGLQIVALTDHNTCRNCPPFFEQAKRLGLIPVAGMELTTAEDIHVVCLFPTLASAMDFDAFVQAHRPSIQNEAAYFGHQYRINDEDEVAEEEPILLLNASELSVEEAYAEVYGRGGACFPAHIDRASSGLIATLGDFPPDPPFTAFELHDASKREDYLRRYPLLGSLVSVVSSDAHTLTDIAEADFTLDVPDEPYSSARVREALIQLLRRKPPHG